MPERTTMHDMGKPEQRANAMDCGLAADVEPTMLASSKEKQGFVLRKEREEIKHHHETAERFEMEIVPFIVDLHGSHGPDARKFLRLLAHFRPRPRLSGENPKARVYEVAASCVLIARKGAEVRRFAYADAHAVRHLQGWAR